MSDTPATLKVCLSCGARTGFPHRHGPTLVDEVRKALRRAPALSVALEVTGCNDLCKQACTAIVSRDGSIAGAFVNLPSDATTAAALVGYAVAVGRRNPNDAAAGLPGPLTPHVVTRP